MSFLILETIYYNIEEKQIIKKKGLIMKGFKRKPIYGIGINDADYTNVAQCRIYEFEDRVWKSRGER